MYEKERQIYSVRVNGFRNTLGIAVSIPTSAQAFTLDPVSVKTVDPNLNPGSTPEVTSTPVDSSTVDTETVPAAGITVKTIPTGIRADGVFNTNGYANLVQDAVMSNPYMD